MRRLILAATFVTVSVLPAAQQSRDVPAVAIGTAQISGTVMTADAAPVPIRRAIVSIKGERSDRVSAVTDDVGRFAFTSLPADRYSLSVSKSAYVPMAYGSKRPGGSGTPVVIADGQRASVTLMLIRGSVIGGTVRDDLGRPVPGVTVTALRYTVSSQSGERILDSVTIGSSGIVAPDYAPDAFPGTSTTDDRGEYRIYGLAPGEYLISASARPLRGSIDARTDVHQITAADLQRAQRLLAASSGSLSIDAATGSADRAAGSRVDYVPVYHPAALSPGDASPITVGPVEERFGVDVLLRLVPAATVSGIVTGPDGAPIAGARVALMTNPLTISGGVQRSTTSNADGEFSLPGVAPGLRQLQASVYADGVFGLTDVMIDGRDIVTSIAMSSGATVSGRIVFDGTSRAPAANAVAAILRRQLFATAEYHRQFEPDGRFVFSGVPPGKYKLYINGRPPAGWVLRSVMVNGSDASDVEFEVKTGDTFDGVLVTLTDRPAEISGVLQNAAGEPAPDYVLVVFSADPRFQVARSRRTQQVRPDINGHFVVRDLPAGDYLISAVTDLENGQWNDPAFLADLAARSPIKISVTEGERKVQDIRIGGR